MTKKSDDDLRGLMYDAIQATTTEDIELEGAVLLGFLLVAEWQSPNGDRWLSKVSGDHTTGLPPWRERMFAYEMAHHWNPVLEEMEDEEA